jgi:hypothetical protein
VNWKHAENGNEELDDSAVHQRERSNKPDNQSEDGQGINIARLVCDKTPDSLNKHAAGLLNSRLSVRPLTSSWKAVIRT